MRDNWNLSLKGASVVLVPYAKKFVEKYHIWMTDPYLQEATASEPLSLEEEYAMQKSWRDDTKKCTFIILAIEGDSTDTLQELDSMVGDVNLFMNDYENAFNAEIEVMIADPRYRRRGLASDALKLMIFYGTEQLKLKRFFAKIGENNLASIALFKR
jgi:RimJ/RimL family protein N-acetyltransferase